MKQGWTTVELGQLCSVQSGDSNTQDAVADGPYVFFDRSRNPKRSTRYLFDCEALIIAGEGAEFRPKKASGKFDLHQRAYAIYGFGDRLLRDFLFYYLEYVHEYFQRVAVGATVKSLRRRHFENLVVALPPLREQKRIVEVLDQAFAALDRARANAEVNAADLIQLRDSIISASLESALDASSNRVSLGELCTIARGGSPRPISRFLTADSRGINWIKISDATASGKFIEGTKERIIPEGVSRSRYVTSGAFLLTNSMSFGRPYILKTNGCIHDGWLVLEPDYEQVDQEYLYYLLGSRQVYGEFDRLAAGSTVRNLNIDLVSRVSVRLPSLEKQRDAVASIISAVGVVHELVKANEAKLADIAALRQSLLQAAFSGQLT